MGLSDFKVHGLLGKGAFGDVYKVTRRSDRKVYALKKVSIRSMSEREVADALNEIRFLASVRHRNVIGFMEAFLDPRNMHLCIVMELADGGDLSNVIDDHKRRKRYIPEEDVWRYFVQICEGLEALHALNILHRDLKSANCFLTREDVVKIGDFNVSRTLKSGLARTQIGTPYYMSPEIWRNRPYDAKSDMWAIGVILYELCALRPPFRGQDMKELSKRVQAGYFARIPSRYSSDLDAVVRALLKPIPAERPTAAECLELPQVAHRRAGVDAMLEGTSAAPIMQPPLLDTIAVPRNLNRITHNLPKACYPETRPDSPGAWPVGDRRRKERLRRERAEAAGGAPPSARAFPSLPGAARASPGRARPPPPRVARPLSPVSEAPSVPSVQYSRRSRPVLPPAQFHPSNAGMFSRSRRLAPPRRSRDRLEPAPAGGAGGAGEAWGPKHPVPPPSHVRGTSNQGPSARGGMRRGLGAVHPLHDAGAAPVRGRFGHNQAHRLHPPPRRSPALPPVRPPPAVPREVVHDPREATGAGRRGRHGEPFPRVQPPPGFGGRPLPSAHRPPPSAGGGGLYQRPNWWG